MDRDNGFLGTGWAFPPTFTSNNCSVELCSNEKDIKQSLAILLSTSPGERLIHPEFGCRINRFVFAELTKTTLTEMEYEIRQSILLFESRIDLDSLTLTPVPLNGKIMIELDYQIVTTNTRDNMVYPFYLQEGTLVSPDLLPDLGSGDAL
jgi:phage baseplate assembly protein W